MRKTSWVISGSLFCLPGRNPGWLLLPLRGNSPSVSGRRYIPGFKCGAPRSESNGTITSGNCSIMYGICSPTANKSCARQPEKTGGKARRVFRQARVTERHPKEHNNKALTTGFWKKLQRAFFYAAFLWYDLVVFWVLSLIEIEYGSMIW